MNRSAEGSRADGEVALVQNLEPSSTVALIQLQVQYLERLLLAGYWWVRPSDSEGAGRRFTFWTFFSTFGGVQEGMRNAGGRGGLGGVIRVLYPCGRSVHGRGVEYSLTRGPAVEARCLRQDGAAAVWCVGEYGEVRSSSPPWRRYLLAGASRAS